MRRAICTALLFGTWLAAFASAEPTTQPAGARLHEAKDFAIALPAGWSEVLRLQNAKRPLHVLANDIGVPKVDDTGAVLEIGIGVQYFEGVNMTLDACVKHQIQRATNAPGLTLIGDTQNRSLKLSDGRNAIILVFEFKKAGGRRSTQIRLITKGDADDHWIASAWAVGGKGSKILGQDKPLATWLIAHLETFVLDPKKFDRAKLPLAFSAEK